MSYIQPGGVRKSSVIESSQELIDQTGSTSIDNSLILPQPFGYMNSNIQVSDSVHQFNDKIKKLRSLQHKAHQDDDLDQAQMITNKIKQVEAAKSQVINFQLEKKKAVDRQDYDTAKVLKFEIQKFKSQILPDEKIARVKSSKFDSRHSVQQSLRSMTPLVKLNPLKKEDFSQQSGFLRVGDGFDGQVLEQSQAISEPNYYKQNDQQRLQNYDQKIPSAIANAKVIDFNSVDDSDFERNLRNLKSPVQKSNEQQNQIQVIDDKTRLFAGPIFSLAQNDEPVLQLFSKYWQKRQKGLEYFINNLNKYIQSNGDASSSINAIILVIQTTIKDKNWQVVKKSISLYNELLKTRQSSKPDQNLIKIDSTSIQNIHNLLFDKLADSNAKLSSQAHDLVLSIFTKGQSVMKSQQLLLKFLKKQSFLQGKAFQSAKHMAGRLKVVKSIVYEYDIVKTGLPINAVMDFIVRHCLKISSDFQMRNLAMDIILALYQRLGYTRIQAWLDKASLAKQYRQSLRDKIPELKESMPEKKQHEPLAKILGISPSNTGKVDTAGAKTDANPTSTKDANKEKKKNKNSQQIKKVAAANDRTST